MEPKPEKKRSRRAILAGAVGAVAAAAMATGSSAEAADGDGLVLGQDNTADSQTLLTAHIPGATSDPTLKIVNTGQSGTALVVNGVGQALQATGLGGVMGTSNHPNGIGVTGIDATGHPFGRGLAGQSGNGWGVWALSENGQALRVEHRAVFRRSGSVTISYPANKATVTVLGPPLAAHHAGPPPTPGSLILAVLQTNLPGVFVRAAVPEVGTNRVTIYLNKAPGSSKAPKSVTVGWFVVN